MLNNVWVKLHISDSPISMTGTYVVKDISLINLQKAVARCLLQKLFIKYVQCFRDLVLGKSA